MEDIKISESVLILAIAIQYDKEKTIYEAQNMSLPITTIEDKYSFTQEDDLKWITYPYTIDDSQLLINNYDAFLKKRYAKIKKLFLEVFE